MFSEDRVYRYTLWREWESTSMNPCSRHDQYVMFIGLNPSTADETKDDPTIRKCIGFAKRWGFGALCMTNLFAFRATDPKVMKKASEPVGERTQHVILYHASEAGLVIAAWGVNGVFRNQDLNCKQWLSSIRVDARCLRKTIMGHPEHPLYVPYETIPILL